MSEILKIPQEGGNKTFRGTRELSGDGIPTKAVDVDSIDSLQVNVLHTATATVVDRLTLLLPASPPGTVKVGDFVTLDAGFPTLDGYYKIGALSTTSNPDDTITLDTSTRRVDSTADSLSVAGLLTDTSGPDFVALGVLVGDIVWIRSGVNGNAAGGGFQEFRVVSVGGATTLTLDGSPQADTALNYILFAAPTLVELPASLISGSSAVTITNGVPAQTRSAGFGDASLSKVVNRAVRSIVQNTEFLRSVQASRIAIPKRQQTSSGHGGLLEVTLSSPSAKGVWTGAIGGGLSPGDAVINEFLRVYGVNGLDLEVGGVTVKVNDIQDGTSASILNRGFVRTTEVGGTIKLVFNLTIPTTEDFVVVYGDAKSLQDIVASEPDAFMKGEFVLTGVDDENIPELVNARSSERLGSFANLDARLESIENRIIAWTWHNTPVFRFDTVGDVHFAGTTIFYEGVLFTASSGSFTTPATGGGNLGQGFIVGTLNTAGNILTFTALDIGLNDFDSLTLAPDQVIVGSYIRTTQINVFNFQTKDSALTFTLEPALEVVNTGSEFLVGWRNTFQVTWKGNTYDGQSSSPTVIGVVGPFNIVGASNDVLTFAFDDTAVTFSVTLTAGGARTAQQVADDINAATDFPLGLGTLATVLNNKVVMRSPSVIGDPAGQALRIIGNGATTVFGAATNDGSFIGVDLADGEILTIQIDESQSDFQAVLRKEVAGQVLNVRRADNKLLIATRSGTQLIPRGSLKDLEPHLVIKGSEELKQVLAVDIAENALDTADLEQLDIVRLADFSPGTSSLQGTIAKADMSDLGASANNDIHLSLFTDNGRTILGRTQLVDVSDVGDYIGAPISDHPSDLAIDTRSNGDLVIAWGDAGTDDGVYTVIANRAGGIVRAADQTFVSANPVDYLDMAIMPNDQIFYAWIEDGASDVLRVGRSSDNGASMAETLAVDTDADSSIRHVAVEIIDTGDANRVRALVFYGKGPSTVTDHRLQVAIIDIDLVAGLSVVATKAAGNFTFEEDGNISSAKTHLNTVGILMNDSTEDKIIEFDQDGEPLDFQVVSSDAELGNARVAAAAISTDKRVTALAAPNKNIVGGEQLFYWFATTDGGGTFPADDPILGLLGWPASIRPSVANPLAEGGSDLKILRQTLVGHRDKYLTGEGRGQRLEVLSLSVALAVLTAHNTQGVTAVSFAQPYTTPPSILVSAKSGNVTGDDALIWSVVPASITTQGFSVEIFNADTTSTGTGNALATAYVIGN